MDSERIWGPFVYGMYRPGNDFELILPVKIETRLPVEGSFGNEFSSICNHCGVMAGGLKLHDVEKLTFLRFLEKRPRTGKLSKLYSDSFHRDTDRRLVFKFRKIWPTGSRWRCLPDKNKNSPGSPALATKRIAPKIYQGQQQTMSSECSRFYPNRFTFGEVKPESVNIVKTGRDRVNLIFGWRLSSSRIITFISRQPYIGRTVSERIFFNAWLHRENVSHVREWADISYMSVIDFFLIKSTWRVKPCSHRIRRRNVC